MINKKIDNEIVDLIKLLNKKGFKTDYSCSGLMEDHEVFNRAGKGYISFLPMSIEKEKELKGLTLSCHLGFAGHGDTQNADFDKNGKMVLSPSDNKKCLICNSFDEKNMIKMGGGDFTITNKMVNDLFITSWKSLEKGLKND